MLNQPMMIMFSQKKEQDSQVTVHDIQENDPWTAPFENNRFEGEENPNDFDNRHPLETLTEKDHDCADFGAKYVAGKRFCNGCRRDIRRIRKQYNHFPHDDIVSWEFFVNNRFARWRTHEAHRAHNAFVNECGRLRNVMKTRRFMERIGLTQQLREAYEAAQYDRMIEQMKNPQFFDCTLVKDENLDRVIAQGLLTGAIPDNFYVKHDITLPNIEPLLDAFGDKLSAIVADVDWKTLLISGALCIGNVFSNWDRPATVLMSIGQFLTTLKLGQHLIKEATEFILERFSAMREIAKKMKEMTETRLFNVPGEIRKLLAQGKEDIHADITPYIPHVGGIITMIGSVLLLKQFPGGDKFSTTYDRFGKISGIIRSITDLQKVGGEMFTALWDSLSLSLFGIERQRLNEWSNIDKWIDEVQELIKPDFENELKNNEELKNTVESLLKRGLNINRFLDAIKVPMTERQSVAQCLMFLMKSREVAGGCGAGQTKPRVAPAIIHIYGDSGVGKSTTLWSLIAELQAALGVTKESDLHEKTYFRRPGAKFWDGFDSGMNIVVCDDFGALKDSDSNPNEEFLEAIHMSNTAFWQLNMAELSEKRNTFFNAKCVLWTSNRSQFAVTSLTNKEAVTRRVDLKIRQYPHPNFAKVDQQNGLPVMILDSVKVNQAMRIHGPSAMLKCVLFDLIDKNTPNDAVLKAGLDFSEVATLCVKTMMQNVRHFGDFNDVLKQHVVGAIERSKNGQWTPPKLTFNPDLFNYGEDTVDLTGFQNNDGLTGFEKDFEVAHDEPCCSVSNNRVEFRRKAQGSVMKVKAQGKAEELQPPLWRAAMQLFTLMGAAGLGMSVGTVVPSLLSDPRQMKEVDKFYGISKKLRLMKKRLSEFRDSQQDFVHTKKFETLSFLDRFKTRVSGTVRDIANNFQPSKHVNVHAVDACILPMSPGVVSDSAEARLSEFLNGKTCFVMNQAEEEAFSTCFLTAESYCDSLPVELRGIETFRNVFHQCEKFFDHYFSVDECGCDLYVVHETRTESIKRRINSWKRNLTETIEKITPMSTTKFLAVASIATAAFALVGYGVYTKLYKKIEQKSAREIAYEQDRARYRKKAGFEGYDLERTKRKQNVAAEVYSPDVTKAKRVVTLEAYQADQTQKKKNPTLESNYPSGDVKKRPNPTVEAQAVYDKNAAEVVSSLYRNMYKLEYLVDGNWRHAMNLTVVKGRLAIVNRHVSMYLGKEMWRIRNAFFEDGIEFHLEKCPCFVVDDHHKYGMRDVMMVELPRVVHQHRDITSKFMDRDEYSMFESLDQVSVIGYVPNDKIMMRQYFGSDSQASDSVFEIEDVAGETLVRVRTLIQYNIQTVGGDCGAVVVAFDKHFDNKIFGIHCAGLSAKRFQGFGTPISRTMINYMMTEIATLNPECQMAPELDCEEDLPTFEDDDSDRTRNWMVKRKFQGNFYPLGVADPPLHASGTSKIMKSPVYGMLGEPKMAPARLHPFRNENGDLVDPMANARFKASPLSKPLDNVRLVECANHFFSRIDLSDEDKKILTHEEAISGIEGDACYPPMKRNTSPGYGWSKVGKGKTLYLGSDEYVYDHPEVMKRCEAIRDKCAAGLRPTTIWSDTLKDERRTHDKVRNGKTRLFSCGEMAFTIVFRQYFAGFIAHMTRNRIDVESCVGVNVYSYDWTRIAQKLKAKGSHILAGDFANYDGTLHPEILWLILDEINAWYNDGPVNSRIRAALWSEIVNSVHVVGNTFYMWNHSQPSGCPMTTILNCTYHSIAARYVFLACAAKYAPEHYSLHSFDRFVAHFNYGDDDLYSIARQIISWYNQETMTEAFKELGMTYTDELKTGKTVAYRTLEEVNFLKRTFRWDADQCRYRAPLALDTILEMANWIHGDIDPYQNCCEIMENAVMELAQHDRETFDTYIGTFQVAARALRPKAVPYFKTYEAYQHEECLKYVV